jgi:hypothetical protein
MMLFFGEVGTSIDASIGVVEATERYDRREGLDRRPRFSLLAAIMASLRNPKPPRHPRPGPRHGVRPERYLSARSTGG